MEVLWGLPNAGPGHGWLIRGVAGMPSHEVVAFYRATTDAGIREWVVCGRIGRRVDPDCDDLDAAVDRDEADSLVAVLPGAAVAAQTGDPARQTKSRR